MSVPIRDKKNGGRLAGESDAEMFERFVREVEPLITGHPDHNFDLILSLWLSHTLYDNYDRWRKSSDGNDKPKHIQVVHLLKLWKSEAGKEANARNFISRIENKLGTKDIVEKIEAAESSRSNPDAPLSKVTSFSSQATAQNDIPSNIDDRSSTSSSDFFDAVSPSEMATKQFGK